MQTDAEMKPIFLLSTMSAHPLLNRWIMQAWHRDNKVRGVHFVISRYLQKVNQTCRGGRKLMHVVLFDLKPAWIGKRHTIRVRLFFVFILGRSPLFAPHTLPDWELLVVSRSVPREGTRSRWIPPLHVSLHDLPIICQPPAFSSLLCENVCKARCAKALISLAQLLAASRRARCPHGW